MNRQLSLLSVFAALLAVLAPGAACAAALCGATVANPPASCTGAQPQIWFAPPDNLSRNGVVLGPDFPKLFSEPQTWSQASSQVGVFALNPYYGVVASDAEIQAIVQYTNARHMQVSLEMDGMVADNCDANVEGVLDTAGKFTDDELAHYYVKRFSHLKDLGLNVGWIVLDSPMAGYDHKGPGSCNYTVDEDVARFVPSLKNVRAVFPKVKFGITEGPPKYFGKAPLTKAAADALAANWFKQVTQELDSYKRYFGAPMDGFVIDTYYYLQPNLIGPTIKILHDNGTQAAYIFDSPGGANVTDQSWMTAAMQGVQQVVAQGYPLDFIMVSSWMKHPRYLLPERDPLSLTSLLGYYEDVRKERDRPSSLLVDIACLPDATRAGCPDDTQGSGLDSCLVNYAKTNAGAELSKSCVASHRDQRLDGACARDAQAAMCGDRTAGEGLVVCLDDYRKRNANFALTPSCGNAMAAPMSFP